ncbi:Uncharacterised protein [Vibrio cholerae]|uniref:Uncharacterized protein n=1 Tax=Vibrio cholerae TaxID=666 RepID=A0A655RVR3_VIBCL|nr:Uncharacterised protein [Vibrio cholerae]CSC19646.1 Uncharacterised protein [Vibrio cholerae]CSC61535.1 Uncharacterised protein [Vibrio cholerae]CSC70700.1 Uncharacterised protein [Vibrio cholerae]CSH84291.1 Uncharacterised protein [Vibrio cholerae]
MIAIEACNKLPFTLCDTTNQFPWVAEFEVTIDNSLTFVTHGRIGIL